MSRKAMCVALTGATGFVGQSVLGRLLDEGYEVRALMRDRSRLTVPARELTIVDGTLFDADSLAKLVQGAQAVIHLVGIIMERPAFGQTFERVHEYGTRNLLAAAKRHGVRRWVQMSAIGARPAAAARYHLTKWRAEELVRNSGLKQTIFRPSVIHGPRGEFMKMVKDFWCKWFPPFVPYFGAGAFGRGGAGRLQPIYVEDVARCFVAALTHENAVGETYPLGGPDAMTWPQLYATCKEYLPGARHKKIMAVPAWYAKLIAGLPGVPFNLDQVIMSQENATCNIEKVQGDLEIELASFEPTFAQYANQIP